MSTRILLLRHASHDLAGRRLAGRMPGVHLNAQGREQAQALRDALAAFAIDAIYASPQVRTQETVAPTAAALGVAVQIAAEFDEIDFGDWTGREIAGMDAEGGAWRTWVDRRSLATPPGGEPFSRVGERTAQGLRRLQQMHDGQTVLVASHGDVIKATLAGVLGLSLDRLESFEIACASLSIVEAGDGWAQVKRVNQPVLAGSS